MQTSPVYFEALVQETYEAILREGDVAIDVGAQRGRHTLAMAGKVFPGGQVLAFEPLPACRAALNGALTGFRPELAPLVKIHDCALSDYSGKTEFVVARDAMAYSGSRKRRYDGPTRLEYLPVEVKRLDEHCAHLPAVRFIKIDSEGSEYHVLRGAEATIRRCRPAVAFEFGVNPLAEHQVTPQQMFQFWAVLGYQLFDIRGNWLGEEAFAASSAKQAIWDYLALPGENADMLHAVASVLSKPPGWQHVSAHLEIAEHQAHASGTGWSAGGEISLRGWLAARVARLCEPVYRRLSAPLLACAQSLLYSNRSLLEILRDRDREIRSHQDHLNHLSRELMELREQLSQATSQLERLARQPDSGQAAPVDRAA
jgi:FkbM family methyltransferase